MLIKKSAVTAYLRARRDDHRWMKDLRHADLLAEVRRLRVRPVFRTSPWTHQLVCFWLGIQYRRFMFALTMGAGKTKIITDIFTQRQRERSTKRGLVAVPRIINIASWMDDLDTHADLEGWPVDVENIEEKRDLLLAPRGDLTIIDYSSLQWALCKKVKGRQKGRNNLAIDDKLMRYAQRLYNFVAVDEIHKLANADSLWWLFMDQLTAAADFSYGLSGTFVDRKLEESWAQMHIVDQGATFGENLGLFRAAFMESKTDNFKGQIWYPRRGASRSFHRALQHRSINYEEDELPFNLPKERRITIPLRMVGEQRDHYLRALDGVMEVNGLQGGLEAAWLRMRQITSGYLCWTDDNGRHKIIFKDNPKLMALERILEEAGDKKVIVCCDYTETGEVISDHLKTIKVPHVWYYGGTKDKVGTKEQFERDPRCRVFLMNSSAGGTGTDGLQKVCQYMVFYESPTPPKERKQTERRIKRPGMIGRSYYYDLTCTKTVDTGILAGHQEGYDFYEEYMLGTRRGRGSLTGL